MSETETDLLNPETAPDWVVEVVRIFHNELARRHGSARRLLSARNGGPRLLDWGPRYLSEHFALPPSIMHLWLARQLDRMWHTRGTQVNLLGPRGSAKSTLATLAYALRAAVERWEPYVWIVSATASQAHAHLENIKSELVDNARLAADYPDAVGKGSVWRGGSIVLNNGVCIEAYGTGQRLRGRRRRAHRPTLIICDDLESDEHMDSALRREHSRNWFHGTLMKAGTRKTNVVNLATALHRDALAMRLHETPGWISRIFRAMRRWPENMSLWNQWEAAYTDLTNPRYRENARAFFDRHHDAMNVKAQVLWPEHEDLYTLMCMRAEGGRAAFEREKQNSPIQPDLCEWPESYFEESIWFDQWPEHLKMKTLALDPSKGSDARRGDFSAFVMLGVDNRGIVYLEADMERRSTPQLVADGVELCRRFEPDAFGVEANQFQDLLATQFEDEFRRQGTLDARPWLLHNRVNKQVRIRRLGPYLASGRLRFKADSPSTRLLIEQLKEFPVGDHDDGPDAVEMALRLASELIGKKPLTDGLPDRLPVG